MQRQDGSRVVEDAFYVERFGVESETTWTKGLFKIGIGAIYVSRVTLDDTIINILITPDLNASSKLQRSEALEGNLNFQDLSRTEP
eukprot:260493-Amphidinium_carterae.3